MLWRITVQREDPAKPKFDPDTLNLQSNDSVFWFNADKDTQHQPYPLTGTPGAWGGVIDPGASSDQLNFTTNVGTYNMKCAFHPDEYGTIVVANTVMLAAGADPLFQPLTITAGQCVSWGNSTSEAHQPCPDTGAPWFQQPIASGDLSAPITFSTAGTVSYKCVIHPNETGTITVNKAG